MKTMFAQVGHLGTTKYYLAKMTAGELIDSVGLAIELPEWDGMTADEKMQREPDLNRVVNEICPYFTEDKDRFFGAIIVDIYSGYDDIIFDSLADKKLDLSAADKYLLKDTGFLTLPGSERLIALDGQHRTLAMKLSIKGKSAITVSLLKDKKMTPEMEALEPHPELAKEEISVIMKLNLKYVRNEVTVHVEKGYKTTCSKSFGYVSCCNFNRIKAGGEIYTCL